LLAGELRRWPMKMKFKVTSAMHCQDSAAMSTMVASIGAAATGMRSAGRNKWPGCRFERAGVALCVYLCHPCFCAKKNVCGPSANQDYGFKRSGARENARRCGSFVHATWNLAAAGRPGVYGSTDGASGAGTHFAIRDADRARHACASTKPI
jgi:hypothetical protein